MVGAISTMPEAALLRTPRLNAGPAATSTVRSSAGAPPPLTPRALRMAAYDVPLRTFSGKGLTTLGVEPAAPQIPGLKRLTGRVVSSAMQARPEAQSAGCSQISPAFEACVCARRAAASTSLFQ